MKNFFHCNKLVMQDIFWAVGRFLELAEIKLKQIGLRDYEKHSTLLRQLYFVFEIAKDEGSNPKTRCFTLVSPIFNVKLYPYRIQVIM